MDVVRPLTGRAAYGATPSAVEAAGQLGPSVTLSILTSSGSLLSFWLGRWKEEEEEKSPSLKGKEMTTTEKMKIRSAPVGTDFFRGPSVAYRWTDWRRPRVGGAVYCCLHLPMQSWLAVGLFRSLLIQSHAKAKEANTEREREREREKECGATGSVDCRRCTENRKYPEEDAVASAHITRMLQQPLESWENKNLLLLGYRVPK